MLWKKVGLLSLAISLIFSSPLYAGSPFLKICKLTLSSFGIGRRINTYVGEVKETNGRRIFSVKNQSNETVSNKSIWFRTPNLKRGYFLRNIQRIPTRLTKGWEGGPFEFTPLKTLEELTWGEYTFKMFGVREEPSKPVKLASGLTLSMAIYIAFTSWLENKTQEKLLADIDRNAPLYDFFLQNDFRAREIIRDVRSKNLTIQEGRILVYVKLKAVYSQWFANRQFYLNRSTNYLRKTLVNFPLFSQFTNVINEGVKDSEGFQISMHNQTPTDGQVRMLFLQADRLAIKNEYITRWIGAPYLLEDDIDPSLFTNDLKEEVSTDRFNRELIELFKSKQISLGDLMYGVQENEYWKTQYEHFATLKIVKLDASSNTPIPIHKIQDEIKIDVFRHSKMHGINLEVIR